MARPLKTGIDYFPLDCNFMRDIKVRKILRSCGANSIAVLISILCSIYQDEGYFIEWDEDTEFLISDDVGVKQSFVHEVVNTSLSVEFFDKSMYENYQILTSKGIQKRYKEATSRRNDNTMKYDYKLVNVNNNGVNVSNNQVNVNNNPVNVDRSTQSKVKESKVKESKVKESKVKGSHSVEPGPTTPPLDLDLVISTWNSLDPNIPRLNTINSQTKRYKLLKARVNQYGFDHVINTIKMIDQSDFLKGYKTDFVVNFDWAILPNNYVKIADGNYIDHDRPQRGPKPAGGYMSGTEKTRAVIEQMYREGLVIDE